MPQTSHSLPVLLEDNSRFDWPNAQYTPLVTVGGCKATIRHVLQAAPALERAIEDQCAIWATELRCPKTLLSRVEVSREPRQVVEWDKHEMDHQLYIIPGILADRDFELSDEGLNPIWESCRLQIPRGWWLARGDTSRSDTLAQSLLRFHLSDDLKDGRMQVKPDESSGDLRFVAYLASDIWPRIELDRTLQISALIGALARLPKELEGIEPEDMPAVAQEIHDRLEHAGVPTWTRSEYDPVLAATAIEPFDQRESDES